MLDVFFTTDVEIWFGGMSISRENFAKAFDTCIRGRTPQGDFGLGYQADTLRSHGLTGVFFIEPLFSLCFGREPLADIVGMVTRASQEVQLHLHTEWVDRCTAFQFEDMRHRENLHQFKAAEQVTLIAAGKQLLLEAGAGSINAFRAGNFGFNRDTLGALSRNRIGFDSSYNASRFGLQSGVMPGTVVVEPVECEGVIEYPVTVFRDGTKSLRHAQVSACSFAEMERLLWQALDDSRTAFVIVSHSFELLGRSQKDADRIAVNRFNRLCRFLADNRGCFRLRGFEGLQSRILARQPPPLASPAWVTGHRMLEQAVRRVCF